MRKFSMHLKHALKNLVHWWNQSSYPAIMLFLWIPIIALFFLVFFYFIFYFFLFLIFFFLPNKWGNLNLDSLYKWDWIILLILFMVIDPFWFEGILGHYLKKFNKYVLGFNYINFLSFLFFLYWKLPLTFIFFNKWGGRYVQLNSQLTSLLSICP